MKNFIKVVSVGLVLSPMIASAQSFTWFTNVTNGLSTLVSALIPIVIGIALLVFIWGLVQFIAASGDDNAKQEGKNKMIWGVISLFVIISIWGIVTLLGTILGVSTATVNPPAIPKVQ